MSEGTSRSIWDIFAHGNEKDISRFAENKTSADVKGPEKSASTSSLSVTIPSDDGNKSKKTNSPKRSPKKGTEKPVTRRSSPRKSKADVVKTEPDDTTSAKNASSDLKKAFEKLKTKVRLPVTVPDKGSQGDGLDAKTGGSLHSAIRSSIDVKKEPPDEDIKMDLSETANKTKTQSCHFNIFERMPILFDTELTRNKTTAASDSVNTVTSHLKSTDDGRVEKQSVCTHDCDSQSSSPSQIKELKPERTGQQESNCKYHGESKLLTDKSSKSILSEIAITSGKTEQHTEVSNKSKSDEVKTSGKGVPKVRKETPVVQKQETRTRNRRKSTISKAPNKDNTALSNKPENESPTKPYALRCTDHSVKASLDSVSGRIDDAGHSEQSIEEIDLTSDTNIEELLNKSGEEYIVLDSLSSQSDSENVQHSPLANSLKVCNCVESMSSNAEVLKKSKSSKPTVKEEEHRERSLRCSPRRSSRKVKVKEFPDSVCVENNKCTSVKKEETQSVSKVKQLTPEPFIDLPLEKASIDLPLDKAPIDLPVDKATMDFPVVKDVGTPQTCRGGHLNKEDSNTADRIGAFGVLDEISGFMYSESQESNKGDIVASSVITIETSKPNITAKSLSDKCSSESLTTMSKPSNSVDGQQVMCNAPAFEQKRPLCILGTTKKKVIVAEVKPNNAAVLTFPSEESAESTKVTTKDRSGEDIANATKVSSEQMKSIEEELPQMYFDKIEDIVDIEMSQAVSAFEASCLEIPSVIKMHRPDILFKDAKKQMAKVQKLSIDSSDGLKKSSDASTQENSTVLSEDSKATETMASSSTKSTEQQKFSKDGSIQITNVEPPKQIFTVEHSLDTESDEDLVSYLSQSHDNCFKPKLSKEPIMLSHCTSSTKEVEKDNLRRSSRRVKPTTKLLEQYEIEHLTFETTSPTDRKNKFKHAVPPGSKAPYGTDDICVKKDVTQETVNAMKKEQSSLAADSGMAPCPIASNASNDSLVQISSDLVKKEVEECTPLNSSENLQQDAVEKVIETVNIEDESHTEEAPISTAIQKTHVEEQNDTGKPVISDKPREEKQRKIWKKCEHKGQKEPGTFEFSKTKLSRQSSFFQEKVVPVKYRRRFRTYVNWKHKQGVISSMLPAEQIKASSVNFHKPKDTDIRVKELKLGQSWKDHLFDHKTQVLKMPKTLVYIPKTNPEDLSFDVPPQFILTKSPSKTPSSKHSRFMAKTKKNLNEGTLKDGPFPLPSTIVASKEENAKKKGPGKRKKSENTAPSVSGDSKTYVNAVHLPQHSLDGATDQSVDVTSPLSGNNSAHLAAESGIKKPRKSRRSKRLNNKVAGIPISGIDNKNLDNVIEFSKFLRETQFNKDAEKPPILSSPVKQREKRSKLNRRVESVKSALHEITKQKVIRKLTGQTPMMPQKNVPVKKVMPLNYMSEAGGLQEPMYELPPLAQGQESLMLPGKAMSVEVVEVERTSTGEMVLRKPADTFKCNLQKSDLLTAPKTMADVTDVSALLTSYLQQQKQSKTFGLAQVCDPTSTEDYKDLSCLVSSKHDLPKGLSGADELDPILVESNNDHDTTISYNDCMSQEGLSEDLFEDFTSEQSEFQEEGNQENSSTGDSTETQTENSKTGDSQSAQVISSDSMPLLSPQGQVEPESHSTPRRSPRRVNLIQSSPIKITKTQNCDSKDIVCAARTQEKQTIKTTKVETKASNEANNSNIDQGETLSSTKPLKRSMLKELTSSEGYIADKITKTSDNLFVDSSRLSREERALQRAILAFNEIEMKKTLEEHNDKSNSQVSTDELNTAMQKQKEKDHAKKKANQIKKNAVKRSNKNVKKDGLKSGFNDFCPEILESRTRLHTPGLNIANKKTVQVSVEEPETVASKPSTRHCVVCGELGTVTRDPPTCGACRVFYIRCLKLDLHYKCSKDGHCPIVPETRSQCSGCRQKKCEEMGLKDPVTPGSHNSKQSQGQTEGHGTSVPYKKLKLDLSDKKRTLTEADSSTSKLSEDDDLPELNFSAACESFSGKGKSKGSAQKGKAWKQKKSTPKSTKTKPQLNESVIMISDEDHSDIMETSKPIVYLDRADMPSPDFGKLDDLPDENDSMFDALETTSISTTMSVDGCRVKIPAEVKKISVNRDSGESVLHKAARLGYRDVVLWCCQTRYADPKGQEYAGFAPIHESCAAGEIEITKILLAYGADVNVASKVEGVRPLHDAVESDHIEMVRLVLSCGADPNLSTYSGKAIKDLVRSDEMNTFLQDYMADVNGPASMEERKPWQFRDFLIDGEEDSEDEDLGQYLFDDVPSDSDEPDFSPLTHSEDDFQFELSESHMIPLYHMTLDLVDGNFAFLHDVMDRLDMTKLEFTRQIEAPIHTAGYECLQARLPGRRIPLSYEWGRETGRKQKAPVDLVRWEGRFRELFGIEEVFIKSNLDPPSLSLNLGRQFSFTPPLEEKLSSRARTSKSKGFVQQDLIGGIFHQIPEKDISTTSKVGRQISFTPTSDESASSVNKLNTISLVENQTSDSNGFVAGDVESRALNNQFTNLSEQKLNLNPSSTQTLALNSKTLKQEIVSRNQDQTAMSSSEENATSKRSEQKDVSSLKPEQPTNLSEISRQPSISSVESLASDSRDFMESGFINGAGNLTRATSIEHLPSRGFTEDHIQNKKTQQAITTSSMEDMKNSKELLPEDFSSGKCKETDTNTPYIDLQASSHLVNYMKLISPDRNSLFAFQDDSFEQLSMDTKRSENKSNETAILPRIDLTESESVKPRLTILSSCSKDSLRKPIVLETANLTCYNTSHTRANMTHSTSDCDIMAQYYQTDEDDNHITTTNTKKLSSNCGLSSSNSSTKDQNWNHFNLLPMSSPTGSESMDYDYDFI